MIQHITYPRSQCPILALCCSTFCLLLAQATADIFSYRKLDFIALQDYPLIVGEAQGGTLGPVMPQKGNIRDTGSLFVCGGFHKFPRVTSNCYSLSYSTIIQKNTAKWKFETVLPTPLTHCATTTWGSRMYFCGGFRGQHPGPSVADCFFYDAADGKWTHIPSLPGNRSGGGLVHLNETHLLYAGGVDRFRKTLMGKPVNGSRDYGDAWIFDLNNRRPDWVAQAPIPNPRNHMGSVGLWCGGKRRVFFVGGQKRENEFSGNQDSLHEFLVVGGVWKKRARLPRPGGHFISSLVEYGCGFLLHGGVYNQGIVSNKIWYYNALTDAWSLAGKFPVAAKSPVCGASSDGNLICSFGGKTFESWLTQLQGLYLMAGVEERN